MSTRLSDEQIQEEAGGLSTYLAESDTDNIIEEQSMVENRDLSEEQIKGKPEINKSLSIILSIHQEEIEIDEQNIPEQEQQDKNGSASVISTHLAESDIENMEDENISGQKISLNYDRTQNEALKGSILSFHPELSNEAEDEENLIEEKFINYQNTYRMQSKKPFNKLTVLTLVNEEINNKFNEETKYDPIAAPKICVAMADSIMNSIYNMNFDRYKIIVTVEIVGKKRQGIYSEIRFLRDQKKDKYVKRLFENVNFIVIVIVVGLYYE
ncbi:Tctex-1 [Cinara cedri]|uniref:Tctex-1 n=1 Tax=Cinara cedri TaxID=506608 RepID=A0A5E4M3W9_9HEMI|nr:Tctex-1 [Cinara cedri]